jgi:hypothetical protein
MGDPVTKPRSTTTQRYVMLTLPEALVQVLNVLHSRKLETRLHIIACAALKVSQETDETLFQGMLCLAC